MSKPAGFKNNASSCVRGQDLAHLRALDYTSYAREEDAAKREKKKSSSETTTTTTRVQRARYVLSQRGHRHNKALIVRELLMLF